MTQQTLPEATDTQDASPEDIEDAVADDLDGEVDQDTVTLVQRLNEYFPPPRHPLYEPWEVSLAALVGKIPKIPKLAVKALGVLDRFGAVHIGPSTVGFDGDEIEWHKVVELHTRTMADLMSGAALEESVERLRGSLPPVPGRKWVVRKGVELMLVLWVLTLEKGLHAARSSDESDEDAPNTDPYEDGRLTCEIVYRGKVRQSKSAHASVVSTAILGMSSSADRCLRQTAEQHGVPIVAVDDGNALLSAAERADAIEQRLASVRAKVPNIKRSTE